MLNICVILFKHFAVDTQNSLEQEVYCAKYEYIKALKAANSDLINQIEDIEKFDTPIKAKGHLSLWEFDLK